MLFFFFLLIKVSSKPLKNVRLHKVVAKLLCSTHTKKGQLKKTLAKKEEGLTYKSVNIIL